MPWIVKEGGSYEIMLKIKQAHGGVGLFTASLPNSRSRETWEAAVELIIVTIEKKSEAVDYVQVRNIVNLKHDFRADLLNMFIDSTSQYDRFCTQFVVKKRMALLCKYFSLLACSKDFTKYCEEEFSEDGFKIDGSGVQQEDLVASGGSLSEYLEFISLAKAHCTECGDSSSNGMASSIQPRKGKSKRITEFFKASCPPKKLTRVEEVEAGFKKECEDKEGLEQNLVSNLVGFKKISLDSLKLCDTLCLPLNHSKVESLAATMVARFDPALCVLTVVVDVEGGKEECFVIHGNHRYAALKQLDALGKFESLPGITKRDIPCYVVGAGNNDPALGIYCQIRANDMATDHQSKAELHELIYVYEFLKNSYKGNHEKAVNVVVERISKLRKVGRDELIYLRKILNWGGNSLLLLIQVLKKYELYQTADTTGKKIGGKIQRGEKLKLTKEMWKKLSGCKPDFFEDHCSAVLDGFVSLRTLLEESSKAEMIVKTKSCLSAEAGYESFESLQSKFPGKLNDDVVEQFLGAQTGKKKNVKGVMLKNFVDKLKNQNEEIGGYKTEELENILSFDHKHLEPFETVLIQVTEKCEDYLDYLINAVALGKKDQFAVMLIFEREQDHRYALSKLEYWEKESKIKISQVFFEKTPGVLGLEGTVMENLIFSLIFGKFCVTQPPLKYLNPSIESSLLDVVSAVSPPGANIAYVTTGTKLPVLINTGAVSATRLQVTYFAPKKVLDKFNMMGCGRRGGIGEVLEVESEPNTVNNENPNKNLEMNEVYQSGPLGKDTSGRRDDESSTSEEEQDDELDLLKNTVIENKEKRLEKQSSTSKC